jgi:hypothetical protein
MKKKILLSILLALFTPILAAAQSTLPAPTPSGTTITVSYPAACTAAAPCTPQLWRCAGSTTVCTATSSNWTLLTTGAAGAATLSDATGVNGTTYQYVVVITQGSDVAPPSNDYAGTPTPPLAAATISGATS